MVSPCPGSPPLLRVNANNKRRKCVDTCRKMHDTCRYRQTSRHDASMLTKKLKAKWGIIQSPLIWTAPLAQTLTVVQKKIASIQRMSSGHDGVDETSVSRIYMLRSWMYVQLSPLLQVPFWKNLQARTLWGFPPLLCFLP